MKRGEEDFGFITHEDQIIAINLGWQFAAEHEWGIRDTLEEFEVPGVEDKSDFGLRGRTITRFPERSCKLVETDERIAILFVSHGFYEEPTLEWPLRVLGGHGDGLITGWSDGSFAIILDKEDSEEEVQFVRDLWEAFQNHDVAIWFMGGGNPIANKGLTLAIASRVPVEADNTMRRVDRAQYELRQAAEQTGIRAKLEKAGKGFFALSPKFIEGQLKFWLNPMEQDRNNCGWFTAEELEQWIEGTGPVPKATA